MASSFRLQIRKQIMDAASGVPATYVFRDVELPFVPVPGLTVQDFDGQEYRITDHLVWREGQHRFISYDLPHREEGPTPRPVEEIAAEYEGRGWKRNQRTVDRMRT